MNLLPLSRWRRFVPVVFLACLAVPSLSPTSPADAASSGAGVKVAISVDAALGRPVWRRFPDPRVVRGSGDWVPVAPDALDAAVLRDWSWVTAENGPECDGGCPGVSSVLSRYGASAALVDAVLAGGVTRLMVVDRTGVRDWSDFPTGEDPSGWLDQVQVVPDEPGSPDDAGSSDPASPAVSGASPASPAAAVPEGYEAVVPDLYQPPQEGAPPGSEGSSNMDPPGD